MKFLGWHSFAIIRISVLYWLPDLFSNSTEVDTAIWVVILFVPAAYYTFRKAKEEK